MKNLSIKQKLIGSFIAVVLIFLISSIFTFSSMKKSNDSYNYLINTVSRLESITQSIQTETALQIGYYRAYMLYANNDYRESFSNSEKTIENLIEQGLELATMDETREWFQSIADIQGQFQQTAIPLMDLVQTDRETALARGLKEIVPITQALTSETDSMIQWLLKLSNERQKETQDAAIASLTEVLIIFIVATIIALLISIFLSNMISKPIRKVMERMNLIANGDLSNEPLNTKLKDEVGQLVNATNMMSDSMKDLLTRIKGVSETVSSHSEELTQSANEVSVGSEQIAMTMEELASGAETQANNASELSSTMEIFTNGLEEANQQGEFVNQKSKDMLEMTTEGSQLMNDSAEQMLRINNVVHESVQKVEGLAIQSKEISKLVVVIKEIADQTNLLALNAAIEAARAGEHGKGFAVVADEVRKLAEQVAHSIEDISSIVNSIQTETIGVSDSLQKGYEEVEQGTNKIQTTEEMFNQIRNLINEEVEEIVMMSQTLEDISAKGQEMSGSIQEIAAVSEQSAAGVEETAAASQQSSSSMQEVTASAETLSQLAEELTQMVQQFKL